MAEAYSKALLSGSTSGKQIKVVATATAGTTIHTAIAGSTSFHEVWLYAVNSSATDVKLTLEWGEATAPDGNIEVTVPAEGGYIVVSPGLILNGGMVIKAFAGTANVIMLNGYANIITVT